MSLLNDALRDLEKREQPMPSGSARPVIPARASRWLYLLPTLALLLAVLTLAWWLVQRPAPVASDEIVQAAIEGPSRIGATDSEPASIAVRPVSEPISTPGNAGSGYASEPNDEPIATGPDPVSAASEPAEVNVAEMVPDKRLYAGAVGQTNSAGQVADPAADSASESEILVERATADGGRPPIIVRRAGAAADRTRSAQDSARRALARGQPEVAISRLRQLLEQQPGATEARILLARTLIATGRSGLAEQVLEEGLGEAGASYELAFWLARSRLERGETEAARAVLGRHRPAPAGNADYYLLEAAALRELGRHQEALEAYRIVADAEPVNGRAWLGAGLSHEALEQPDAAESAYSQAVSGDHPDSARFAAQRLETLQRRMPPGDLANSNL